MQTETLLAETGFLERLAASLTFGSEDPDDVVQQTWLAALSHPPREEGTSRAWLAVVLRNVLLQSRRSRLRRAAREMVAARPEATSPADEVRRREESRARVVQAVLALAEPYRTAVLLRYFEELPPRKIATRLDVPVATVKSRIARGLRQLRATLDEEFGGDRRSWAFALLPLAGIRGSGASGGIAAATTKLAAGLVAASVLVAVGVTLFGRQSPPALSPEDVFLESPFVRLEPPVSPADDIELGNGSRSTGGNPADPIGRPRKGRVVDRRGRGVSGAMALIAVDPLSPVHAEECDADGRFTIPRGGTPGVQWICACKQDVGASPWVPSRKGARDVVLELAPAGIVSGVVAHPETGEVVPLATVRIKLGWDWYQSEYRTRTDAEGRYRVSGVPLGTWVFPVVPGGCRSLSFFSPSSHDLREQHDAALAGGQAAVLSEPGEVFTRNLPARRMRGVEATLVIVPPPGSSLPETVSVVQSWRWARGWTVFRKDVDLSGRGEIPLYISEGRTSIRVDAEGLCGVVPLREIEEDGPAESIRVALQSLPKIKGRLVDEEGRPVHREGVEVEVTRWTGGSGSPKRLRTDDRGELDLAAAFVPTTAGYPEGTTIEFLATVSGYSKPTREFPNRKLHLSEIEELVREAGGESLMIDIPLRRSVKARFTVVDSDGNALSGVRLYPAVPDHFLERDWTSDGRGEVEVGMVTMPGDSETDLRILARHPFKADHFDVGSALLGARFPGVEAEPIQLKVRRYRVVQVKVLSGDGAVLANQPVTLHRREYVTDQNGEFPIELLDRTTRVTVNAKGFLPGHATTANGRAEVVLRAARRITVQVIAPPEVEDQDIEVRVVHAEKRYIWDRGKPGNGGLARSVELQFPEGVPARIVARAGDLLGGESPVPEGARSVEVALRSLALVPTELRFVHPDGTPATGVVSKFSLHRDTEHSRRNLQPDVDGIITLDLPPGPNAWGWDPTMEGHRLVGRAPRFTVPSPDPVEIVMERAVEVSLILDGRELPHRIDDLELDVSVSGPEGKVDCSHHTSMHIGKKTILTVTFREGPATVKIGYDGKTYLYEYEKARLEPAIIRLK